MARKRRVVHHSGRRSLLQGAQGIVVAVEIFALQSEKHISALHPAAVSAHRAIAALIQRIQILNIHLLNPFTSLL